ncbi:MAG: methionyl-tRNA formyltransferase [Planctomycetota bacterium]|jgi:methionyl-tRNA formyltransferase
MKKKIEKIVFMGTPEFAVPCLEKLLKADYNVVGVITAPDRPAGRGKKLRMSAVKEFALSKDLNILQPTNLKNKDFQEELKALNADIQVVVAFRMLPEAVWNMPPMGSINLHASLLPQYRGAAPINWAIINGEKETGVSTFFLQHEIDTGKIIFQEKVAIKETDYLDVIYDKLMNTGAKLIVKTIDAVNEGVYPQIAQDHIKEIQHAPKIFKETCEIDSNNSANNIYNKIRGLSPYPAAWTKLDSKTLKIYKANPITEKHSKEIGFIELTKEALKYYCKDGYLEITELQLEGKKRMKTKDFLKGFKR